MKGSNKKFWDIKAAAGDTGEMYIYGLITSYKWDDEDVTAASFKKDLDALGDIKTLNIYVNSPGGSVFQAQAIHTILKRHSAKKNIYVDGIAASAASFLAMAGDVVLMPKNAMMMVHNPMNIVMGNAAEFRKMADSLDKIRDGMIEAYMVKLEGKTTEGKLGELLDTETWLTAQECLDYGFCDELIEEKNVAACVSAELFARYKNVPECLQQALQEGGERIDEAARQAIIAESKADLEALQKILGGM